MSTEFPILEGLDEYSGEYINKFELYKAERGSLAISHADFQDLIGVLQSSNR